MEDFTVQARKLHDRSQNSIVPRTDAGTMWYYVQEEVKADVDKLTLSSCVVVQGKVMEPPGSEPQSTLIRSSEPLPLTSHPSDPNASVAISGLYPLRETHLS